MASTKSFEVYSFKQGKWNIDSVYDDKQHALHEARVLLESRHLTGVKVIRETYDVESEKSSSMVIFNETKGVEKPKPRRPEPKPKPEAAVKPPPRARKKKQGDFSKYIVKLVVVLGGMLLGAIMLIGFYISTIQ